MASIEGHLDIAQLLIENAAQVNAEDLEKYTPLHLASYHGHFDVAYHLIANGASKDAKSRGMKTPLDMARSERMRQLLLGQ